jgi:LmbE family N-acetylglucosaminyl deacetylase
MRSSPQVPSFSRVLCVAAHPDDLEFGVAGTAAVLSDDGADVVYVIATRGQSGSNDPRWTPESLARAREEEQRKAASTVGAQALFLDFMDAYVEDTIELRREISREIRRHQPELIVSMRPGVLSGGFINHPDHRNVATAVLDSALMGATTRLIFPELLAEGLEPWEGIQEVWLMGPGSPGDEQVTVDITDTIERKVRALRCHETQLGEWDPTDMLRSRARDQGAAAGFAFAETFDRIIRRRRPARPARSAS